MLKQATKEALILIFVSISVALLVYWVRPDAIELEFATDSGESAIQSTQSNSVSDISLAEAANRYKEASALFVDARKRADFDAGHIQGAVNLSLADKERWLSDFLASTDPATTIITYCDGEVCHLAPDLAEFLFFNGFDNVRYLKNGWSLWREGGYPVE